jgi:hypothetical protein
MLNCALAVGGIWCLERYWTTDDSRFCYMLAVIAGLGLANHALFRIWTPLFVVALVWSGWKRKLHVIAPWILLLFFALAAYLYLPAAALGEPVHNWGDPSNFSRFWDHVNAREIRFAFQKQMTFSPFLFEVNLFQYVRQLWSSLGPLLLFGVAVCLFCFCKMCFWRPTSQAEKLGFLVGCLVVSDSFYAVIINPMGLKDYQNGQLSTMLLAVIGALFLAKALSFLAWRVQYFSRPIAWSSVLVIPAGLIPFMEHEFYGIDRDWTVEDLAVIQTSLAEPEAMMVLVSDSLIAANLYVNTVLDARPDMAVFGRNHVANGRRFAYTARRQPVGVVDGNLLNAWEKIPYVTRDQFLERTETMVRWNMAKRAIYWEIFALDNDLSESFVVLNTWPIGQVAHARAVENVNSCVPEKRSYCGGDVDVPFAAHVFSESKSKYYRHWLAREWGGVGKRFFGQGKFLKAMEMYSKSAQLAPQRAVWRTNIAVCLAALGRYNDALTVVEQAIDLDPLSLTAVKNGILYAKATGNGSTQKRFESHLRRLVF